MADWTPPASGTPCWINISVKDVARAQEFYSTVFDWAFEPSRNPDKYPPENIAFFHPPDRKSSPGGAISKSDGGHLSKLDTPNTGDAGLYLFVADLEESMKKIVKAGGKKGSEILNEGDMGRMQHFTDTEGNYLGIYSAGQA